MRTIKIFTDYKIRNEKSAASRKEQENLKNILQEKLQNGEDLNYKSEHFILVWLIVLEARAMKARQ